MTGSKQKSGAVYNNSAREEHSLGDKVLLIHAATAISCTQSFIFPVTHCAGMLPQLVCCNHYHQTVPNRKVERTTCSRLMQNQHEHTLTQLRSPWGQLWPRGSKPHLCNVGKGDPSLWGQGCSIQPWPLVVLVPVRGR